MNQVPAPAVFERLGALADPIRGRLLLALERQELSVREIQTVLQLPQSTVSRHLKVLADLGLVATRSEGTSNWYRMPGREQEPAMRRLWLAGREAVAGSPSPRRGARPPATGTGGGGGSRSRRCAGSGSRSGRTWPARSPPGGTRRA